MSGLVCFIPSSGAGGALRGLRLADRRGVVEWTPGAAGDAEGEHQRVLAGARWIAEQVGRAAPASGRRRSLTICLDLDGGRCSWLTAPSAEHDVVRAAAQSAALAAGDESAAGPGLGVVWAPEHGSVGSDLSIQGLAEPAANGHAASPRSATAGRHRLAVLAVPDAAARVLLDELDRLGVTVDGVMTLWHAVAAAWDPARAEAVAGAELSHNGTRGHDEVATSEPVTAVVMVEPAGRLVWAWTRGGRLLAAGSQRLRTLEIARAAPAETRTEAGDTTARRLPQESGRESTHVLEVSRADTGRVVSEWLAWAAQLGAAPARVVTIGPGEIVATGMDHADGLGAVGQALAAAWPGSAATAVTDDDPVGATLVRVAGDESPAAAPALDADGGRLLVELSSRPGRLTRTMHWWLAAAGVAAALVVGAIAWQIDRGADRTRALADEQAEARRELFKRGEKYFPRLASEPDPARAVDIGLIEVRKSRHDIGHERPLAAVLQRVAEAARNVPELRLKKFQSTSLTSIVVDFAVSESKPGADLLNALRSMGPLPDGTTVLWSGDTSTTTTATSPGSTEQSRVFKLRGLWQDPKPAAPRERP